MPDSRRNPRRFSQDQVEAQQNLALKMWLGGVEWDKIAERLSDDDRYGWGDVSVSTIRRRVKGAVQAMAPHDDWSEYAARQLAELSAARDKVNQAIFVWRPDSDVGPLASAVAALVKLHEREATLAGGDTSFGGHIQSALRAASVVEEVEVRTSVQRIMLDPVAFPAALAALEEVEALVESKDSDNNTV